jgi:hypothetical protein
MPRPSSLVPQLRVSALPRGATIPALSSELGGLGLRGRPDSRMVSVPRHHPLREIEVAT